MVARCGGIGASGSSSVPSAGWGITGAWLCAMTAAASREGLTASRQVDPLQRPVTLGFQAVLGEPSVRASCPERATPRAHNLDGRGILPIRPAHDVAE